MHFSAMGVCPSRRSEPWQEEDEAELAEEVGLQVQREAVLGWTKVVRGAQRVAFKRRQFGLLGQWLQEIRRRGRHQ